MRKEATNSHGSWSARKEQLEINLGDMEELENQIN